MDTTTATLTTADIDRVDDDGRYLGWGYNGERAMREDDAEVYGITTGEADAIVIAEARERGWSYDDLFEWCNSKPGRWFGDLAFGGGHHDPAEVRRLAGDDHQRLFANLREG